MRAFRLTIEYDGTDFSGWQVQPGQRTVQGELIDALETALGERVTLMGAGRTDSGVHARGQVASFHTARDFHAPRLQRSLNGLTGRDVVIRGIECVDDSFDARRSARARHYRYRIADSRTAINRHRAWFPGGTPDWAAMQGAANALVGTHDFSSFAPSRDLSPDKRCRIYRARLDPWEDGRIFDIEANRFLHHMVRNIVGTLVDVGLGRRSAASIPGLLAARDRRLAGPTAPAQGLTLWQVRYDR